VYRLFILCAVLLLGFGSVHAEPAEPAEPEDLEKPLYELKGAKVLATWNCSVFLSDEILVVAIQFRFKDEGYDRGAIKVAGTIHYGLYSVEGFDRRINFGMNKEQNYDYAFVIKPNGAGAYYDFSRISAGEVVQPDAIYQCEQVK
jgi:hypothetical protein